jgi:hypothetical protein
VNIKRYEIILIIIALAIAFGIVGQSDFEEAERQDVEYCEMVQIWKQTKGQAGHPDYNDEQVCKK